MKELGINGVCSEKLVLYFVDGDQNQPKCGECTPGTSGFYGAERTCKVDEFCSDQAKCTKVKEHQLFGAACPYDTGIRDTTNGFCGPGLRCIQHKCFPCENGEMDMDTGMICVNNIFTHSAFQKMLYEPTPMILLSISALYIIYQLLIGISVFVKCLVKRRRRVNRMLEQQEKEEFDPASVYLEQSRKGLNASFAYSSDEDEEEEEESDDDKPVYESYEGKIFEDRDEYGNPRFYTVRAGRSVWLSDADIRAMTKGSPQTRGGSRPTKELPSIPTTPKTPKRTNIR